MQPIQITDKAANHINALLSKAPEGTKGLRLTIKTTGCSGHSYEMEYIKADDDLANDEKFEQHDASLYIPRMHSWMLFGMTVDYVTDELGNSKFDFVNPNESGRCGCGESFHVSREELAEHRQVDS